MHETCLCQLPRKVEDLELAVKRLSATLDLACVKLARLDRRLTAQEWRDELWLGAQIPRMLMRVPLAKSKDSPNGKGVF